MNKDLEYLDDTISNGINVKSVKCYILHAANRMSGEKELSTVS